MYKVIPDNTNLGEIPTVKKAGEIVNKLLTGSKRKAFGFYDFIVLLFVSTLYFFFTGLALVLGRTVPRKWLEMGYTLGDGKAVKGLKRIKDKKKSSKGSGRAVSLKAKPEIDLLNN